MGNYQARYSELRRYHFKINDDKLENFLDKKENISDYFRNLTELDMKGKLFKADDIKKENEVLKNLKLKIDIWKDLKVEGFTLDKAYDLFKGHSIPQLTTEKLQETFHKEEPKGLDPVNQCSDCNHIHTDTEPRVCTDLYCNCGVRG